MRCIPILTDMRPVLPKTRPLLAAVSSIFAIRNDESRVRLDDADFTPGSEFDVACTDGAIRLESNLS